MFILRYQLDTIVSKPDMLEYLAQHFPEVVARELLKTSKGSVVAVHYRELKGMPAYGFSLELIDYLETDTEKTDIFLKQEVELSKVIGIPYSTIDEERREAITFREEVWARHGGEILGYIRYPYGFMEECSGMSQGELEIELAKKVRRKIRDFVTPI